MSSLYLPYKALGIVIDRNPFSLNILGHDIFVTASIYNSFQIYRKENLNCCLVSEILTGRISCLASVGLETFVAVENIIHVFHRTKIVRSYDFQNVKFIGMISIGDFLICYDDSIQIYVIDIKAREVHSKLQLLECSSSISTIIHPSTYVNKILIGYTNAKLELWNIKTKKLIYTFFSHIEALKYYNKYESNDDFENSSTSVAHSIDCIKQSPAESIVALGFASGDILLINLKLDRVLFSFKQSSGSVTSLTFRTDLTAQAYPYLVSSSTEGQIYIWNLGNYDNHPQGGGGGGGVGSGEDDDDLESFSINDSSKNKLFHVIEDAHASSVTRVEFCNIYIYIYIYLQLFITFKHHFYDTNLL